MKYQEWKQLWYTTGRREGLWQKYNNNRRAYNAAYSLDDIIMLLNIERGMETFRRSELRLARQTHDRRQQLAGRAAAEDFVEALKTKTMSKSADFVFISIDFEGAIDRWGITEFGVARLDTRDVVANAPTISGHNYVLAHGHKRGFKFGEITRIDKPQLARTIKDVCHVTDVVDEAERRVVLVGHGIHNELSILEKNGVKLTDLTCVIGIFDTGKLSKDILGQTSSLEKLLVSLCLPLIRNQNGMADWLHCAGNDAHYTLRALLSLLYIKHGQMATSNIEILDQVARAPLPAPRPQKVAESEDWDPHLGYVSFEELSLFSE